MATFAACGFAAALATAHVQQGALDEPQDRIVHYLDSSDLADPVTALQKRLDDGKAKLDYEPAHGYLKAVLREFKIPYSSQSLVFSKTSTQKDHTSPKTPRAVYFNDRVYIGWAQDDPLIDVIAIDPKKGPVFFTLDQKKEDLPRFTRSNECMACHLGPRTLSVPGLLVRSIYTASSGKPLSQIISFMAGHSSPLSIRWGGWYVTGKSENDVHIGNAFVEDRMHPESLDPKVGSNITSLDSFFDTSKYIAPGSDIVGLLVLEHNMRMQNLITHARYETLYAQNDRLQNPKSDWPKQRIVAAGDLLLAYMLFRDEAKLKGKVSGTSSFAKDFEKQGVVDSKGRSLRTLDLKTKLFRYPCSYLIQSESFDNLPAEMRTYLWARLDEILMGVDKKAPYDTLTAEERSDVLEILLDTKPEFKAYMAKAHFFGVK